MSLLEDRDAFGQTATLEDFVWRLRNMCDLYQQAEAALSVYSGDHEPIYSVFREIALHYKFVYAYLFQVARIEIGTPELCTEQLKTPIKHSARIELNNELSQIRYKIDAVLRKLRNTSFPS